MSKRRRQISEYEIRNPDKILSNLINDYAEGRLDDYKFLHRAVVVDIDNVGGLFESNPDNPKGSVKARIISDGSDNFTDDDDLNIYWPMFPFINFPIKQGEHIYVIFEDDNREHGLWLTRISEPNNDESKNYTPGIKKYIRFSTTNSINRTTVTNAERMVQDADGVISPIQLAPNFVVEQVQDFNSRVGDHTIYGSNNTLINLGRDRVSDVTTGLTEGAGTIDLVAGRIGENIDLMNDKSRIQISANTQSDTNYGIQAGQNANQAASIIVKSDEVRIISRRGTKIITEGGDIVIQTPANILIEGANISIGLNAQEHAILGDTLKSLLEQLIDQISLLTVNTSMGPSSPPNNSADFVSIKNRLSTALSQTVKVKQ